MFRDVVEKVYCINREVDVNRLSKFIQYVDNRFEYQIVTGIDPGIGEYKDQYNQWALSVGADDINYHNFNWSFYLSRYPDLVKAGINNKNSAWDHWYNHGQHELRSCIPGLDISHPGQWGCLMSHIKVIQDAITNNYKNILILEDDVNFDINIINNIYKVSNIIENNPEWKIIYLGGGQNDWSKVDIQHTYYHPNNTTGTFAYMVNVAFYQELLDTYSSMLKPADVYLMQLQERYHSDMYVLFPNLIICDLLDSSTGGSYDIMGVSYWKEKFKWK